MSRATTESGQLALFDLRSFGCAGPKPRSFSPHQLAQIARTVRRTPEVMVKVSGGAKTLQGAVAHFRYIGRRGTLEVETDDGRTLRGKEAAAGLVDSWDLAGTHAKDRNPYRGRPGRPPSKLVHNVVFSMPGGTAPDKVLAAVRGFAREQFGLQHRYALVLHTDQDHPHVHLAVKSVGGNGRRLNIRKATFGNGAGPLQSSCVRRASPRTQRPGPSVASLGRH